MPVNDLAPAPVAPRRGFAMGLMVFSSVLISFGGLLVRNIEAGERVRERRTALQQVVVLGIAGRDRRRIGADLRRHRLPQLPEPRPQSVPIPIDRHATSLARAGHLRPCIQWGAIHKWPS